MAGAIPGAVAQTLNLTSNGSYAVRADSTNGCGNLSDPFVATHVGITEIVQNNESGIYPNPAINDVFIEIPWVVGNTRAFIEIIDLKGLKQTTLSEVVHPGKPLAIDISKLVAGMYIAITNNKPYKFIKSER